MKVWIRSFKEMGGGGEAFGRPECLMIEHAFMHRGSCIEHSSSGKGCEAGKLVSVISIFIRTVNCTDSICKLIDRYHVFKNNCSLTAIITKGFGEPLAFYLHTHPLTVLPH